MKRPHTGTADSNLLRSIVPWDQPRFPIRDSLVLTRRRRRVKGLSILNDLRFERQSPTKTHVQKEPATRPEAVGFGLPVFRRTIGPQLASGGWDRDRKLCSGRTPPAVEATGVSQSAAGLPGAACCGRPSRPVEMLRNSACRTTPAPIFTNFSRTVVSDQCRTAGASVTTAC